MGGVAGGKEHADYLERVKRAAAGLPVHIHTDLPYGELKRLYEEAAIYCTPPATARASPGTRSASSTSASPRSRGWAAAPFRSSSARRDRRRSSGTTWTANLWHSLGELARYNTREVAGDAGLRDRLAAAAIERSKEFSEEHFRRHLLDLVEGIPMRPTTGLPA